MVQKFFRGIPISIGYVKGRVKKLNNEQDFNKVEPGDILLVYRSSPLWIVPLMRASGLICEIGGRLSHIAIICRELSLPGVSGVEGIFNELSDNDVVFLNGETGEIIKDE